MRRLRQFVARWFVSGVKRGLGRIVGRLSPQPPPELVKQSQQEAFGVASEKYYAMRPRDPQDPTPPRGAQQPSSILEALQSPRR